MHQGRNGCHGCASHLDLSAGKRQWRPYPKFILPVQKSLKLTTWFARNSIGCRRAKPGCCDSHVPGLPCGPPPGPTFSLNRLHVFEYSLIYHVLLYHESWIFHGYIMCRKSEVCLFSTYFRDLASYAQSTFSMEICASVSLTSVLTNVSAFPFHFVH